MSKARSTIVMVTQSGGTVASGVAVTASRSIPCPLYPLSHAEERGVHGVQRYRVQGARGVSRSPVMVVVMPDVIAPSVAENREVYLVSLLSPPGCRTIQNRLTHAPIVDRQPT